MRKKVKALAEANRVAMLKIELSKLSFPQLIALCVQKQALPYEIAVTRSKKSLVEALAPVEGILTPETA